MKSLLIVIVSFSLNVVAASPIEKMVCASDDKAISFVVKKFPKKSSAIYEGIFLNSIQSKAFLTLEGFKGDTDNNRSVQLVISQTDGDMRSAVLIQQIYTERQDPGMGFRTSVTLLTCQ